LLKLLLLLLLLFAVFWRDRKSHNDLNGAFEFLHSDLQNTLFCNLYSMFFVTKIKILEMIPVEGDHFICGG
jgi:hypothetical protein